MTQAQLVTVPILDARIHGVTAEIRVLEGKLEASIQAHKADMQRLGAELDAKLAQMETRIDAKLVQMDARIDAKLAQVEAKLVRWVFLVMLGNVALSLAANTVLNALKSL